MLGIPYAGIQYFKSQGIWYDSEGNPHADIWIQGVGAIAILTFRLGILSLVIWCPL
ncbi:hypothetical protein H6F95_06230 [Cyanobacteria bacterium FACHB-471]|nr:hypothetical protein [Cyanobacteria bacterium FACHB-471]